MRTITAMFDDRAAAETARSRLAAAGISEDQVSIHDKSSLSDSGAHSVTVDNHEAGSDVEADGREGTHRNAIGDYIDNRSGKRLGEDSGSERTALGDYIDDGSHQAGHVDAGHHHDHGHHEGAGLWSRIKAFFSGDDDVYEEGMRRGGSVVTARVADGDVERVTAILDDEGTVDLDDRIASWRNEGWDRASVASSANATVAPGRAARVRAYDWNHGTL